MSGRSSSESSEDGQNGRRKKSRGRKKTPAILFIRALVVVLSAAKDSYHSAIPHIYSSVIPTGAKWRDIAFTFAFTLPSPWKLEIQVPTSHYSLGYLNFFA